MLKISECIRNNRLNIQILGLRTAPSGKMVFGRHVHYLLLTTLLQMKFCNVNGGNLKEVNNLLNLFTSLNSNKVHQ